VDGQPIFRGVLVTSHCYLSFGDHDGEWPDFETGEEPVVATDSVVYVACADDDLMVEVRTSETDDLRGRELIYDGSLTADGLQIGTFMSTGLEPLDVTAGTYRLRVYVDTPGEATSILFLCSPP
jgi:hypothetical protein